MPVALRKRITRSFLYALASLAIVASVGSLSGCAIVRSQAGFDDVNALVSC